jgi:hypothetical protein
MALRRLEGPLGAAASAAAGISAAAMAAGMAGAVTARIAGCPRSTETFPRVTPHPPHNPANLPSSFELDDGTPVASLSLRTH